jgi:hypothetical protein
MASSRTAGDAAVLIVIELCGEAPSPLWATTVTSETAPPWSGAVKRTVSPSPGESLPSPCSAHSKRVAPGETAWRLCDVFGCRATSGPVGVRLGLLGTFLSAGAEAGAGLQNAVPAKAREQARSRRGEKLYGLDFGMEAPFWLLQAVNGHG